MIVKNSFQQFISFLLAVLMMANTGLSQDSWNPPDEIKNIPAEQSTSSTTETASVTTCPKGTEFNSELNKCTNTAAHNENNLKLEICYKKYSANAELLNQCLKENALKATNDQSLENFQDRFNEQNGFVASAHTKSMLAATAVPFSIVLYGAIKYGLGNKKATGPCLDTSYYLMLAATASTFGGELSSHFFYKKRAKEIEENSLGLIQKATKASESTSSDTKRKVIPDIQKEIWLILRDQEHAYAQANKRKMIGYYAAAGLFGISAAMNWVDVIKKKGICGASKVNNENHNSKEENGENKKNKSSEDGSPQNEINKAEDEAKKAEQEAAIAEEKAEKAKIEAEEAENTGREEAKAVREYSNKANSLAEQARAKADEARAKATKIKIEAIIEDDTKPKHRKDIKTGSDQVFNEEQLEISNPHYLSFLINLIFIQSSWASDIVVKDEKAASNYVIAALGLSTITALTTKSKFMEKVLFSPLSRAVVSTSMAVWSGILGTQAKKRMEDASKRAEAFEKTYTDFSNSAPNITLSECNQYRTTDGEALPWFCSRNFCMTNKMVFDPKCECKSTNSCLSHQNLYSKAKLGVNNPAGVFIKIAEDNFSGNLSELNFDELAKKSSLILKSSLQNFNKNADSSLKQSALQSKGNLDQLANRLGQESMKSNQSAGSLESLNTKPFLNKLPQNIVSSIKTERAEVLGKIGQSESAEVNDLFALFQNQPTTTTEESENYLQKKYNYGDTDITSSDQNSLFDVVSQRYKKKKLDTNDK